MRAANVGSVIIEENGHPSRIVTDRDIAVRRRPRRGQRTRSERTPESEIGSKDLTTVSPDDDLDRAVQFMREKAVRRVLVVDPRIVRW